MKKNNDNTVMIIIGVLFILLAFGQYKIYRSQQQLKQMVSEGILQMKELVQKESVEKTPMIKGK